MNHFQLKEQRREHNVQLAFGTVSPKFSFTKQRNAEEELGTVNAKKQL